MKTTKMKGETLSSAFSTHQNEKLAGGKGGGLPLPAAASGAVPGAGSGAVPGAVPGAGSGAAAASAARLRSAARRLCSRFFWDLLGGVVLARAGSAGSTVTDGASTSDAIARRGAKIQQGLESSLREESCWELYRAQRLAYEAPVV